MVTISMKDMLDAGVHFGHPTRKWNPKMKPFIFEARNSIHIIDLQQTVEQCKRACKFVTEIVGQGGNVLFVGTKKNAQEVIIEQAKRANQYYIASRWLGGLLTNYKTIRLNIDRLKEIERLELEGYFEVLPKKEVSKLKKELKKLQETIGGIKDMKKMPSCIFILDIDHEKIAVLEAKKLGIPIVAVVDTNCNPDFIDYVIAGNDDALKAIKLFTTMISDACLKGSQLFEERVRAQTETEKQRRSEPKERRPEVKTKEVEVEVIKAKPKKAAPKVENKEDDDLVE